MPLLKRIKKLVGGVFRLLALLLKYLIYALITGITLGNFATYKITKRKHQTKDKKIAVKRLNKIIVQNTPSKRVLINK